MKPYQTFIFDSYAFDAKAGKIELNYSLDNEVKFTETIVCDELRAVSDEVLTAQSSQLDAALFSLHLIAGISYYKTCVPKKIEIRSGTLNKEQAKFWTDVYENGLGEFFFKNDIDWNGLINFPVNGKKGGDSHRPAQGLPFDLAQDRETPATPPRVLVPIGGGKDSIVTVELLKAAKIPVTLLRMGSHPIIDEVARISGCPMITVSRQLSPALFKLNEEGALNGHVPITAYLSILSVIVAMLTDHDAVVLSNERSASYGNVVFHGKEINHQWSKSLAFEEALQAYLKNSVGTDIAYFSLLRPLSELSIVEMFTKYPQYFETFTSCNANWKILEKKEPGALVWCGECPKCAFAYILFAAFLSKRDLMNVFQENFLSDKALLPLYRELLGIEGIKPFECVGTPDEVKAAFLLVQRKGDHNKTPVIVMFEKEVLPTISNPKKLIEEALKPSKDHAIPVPFSSIIKS